MKTFGERLESQYHIKTYGGRYVHLAYKDYAWHTECGLTWENVEILPDSPVTCLVCADEERKEAPKAKVELATCTERSRSTSSQ